MADPKTILKSLATLQEYYRHDYNQTQVELLTRLLRPIPNGLLKQSVEAYIAQEDRWLPKASQLLSLAKGFCGYQEFASLPEEAFEPTLGSRLQGLKNQACREGVIDHAAWRSLEKEAERRGLEHTLKAIRRAHQIVLDPQTWVEPGLQGGAVQIEPLAEVQAQPQHQDQ
jgi:hypothetical protein